MSSDIFFFYFRREVEKMTIHSVSVRRKKQLLKALEMTTAIFQNYRKPTKAKTYLPTGKRALLPILFKL